MTAMTRRDFVKFFSTIAFAGDIPLGSFAVPQDVLNGSRRVILIELNGGNDGLNTLVPYTDPHYIQARQTSLQLIPNHASSYRRVIPFSEWSAPEQSDSFKPAGFGVHAHLDSLSDCWRQGELAMIQGIGFSSQNRSHFKGISDWNRGVPITSSNDTLADRTTGWLTRLWRAEGTSTGSDIHAVHLGRVTVTPVFGPCEGLRSLGLNSPEDMTDHPYPLFRPSSEDLLTDQSALRTVLNEMNNAHGVKAGIVDAAHNAPSMTGPYPESSFGSQCRSTARLIAGGLACPFYKLSISGFDTHKGQITIHGNLLRDLADGIAALRTSLREAGAWESTLIMTYSEFGRRLHENGSRGTDHGLAAMHLMAGGAVKGGFYGQAPSLRAEDLDGRGDIRPGIDARRYFATAASFLGFSSASRERALGIETGSPGQDLTPIDCLSLA